MGYLFRGELNDQQVVALRDALCAEFQATEVDGVYIMQHGFSTEELSVFRKHGATPLILTAQQALSLIPIAMESGAFSSLTLMFHGRVPRTTTAAIEDACDNQDWVQLKHLVENLGPNQTLNRLWFTTDHGRGATLSLGVAGEPCMLTGLGAKLLLPAIKGVLMEGTAINNRPQ